MPDDTRGQPLYDYDYYAWTQQQAGALRALAHERSDTSLDFERLAEEVEDLGKSERNAVRSHVRRIIEHLLKLQHSPATDPRGEWMLSVLDSRQALKDSLTPSLRRDVAEQFSSLYEDGRQRAEMGLRAHGETEAAASLPEQCPYTLEQVLASDWYP
jgi:hypothetical protein